MENPPSIRTLGTLISGDLLNMHFLNPKPLSVSVTTIEGPVYRLDIESGDSWIFSPGRFDYCMRSGSATVNGTQINDVSIAFSLAASALMLIDDGYQVILQPIEITRIQFHS